MSFILYVLRCLLWLAAFQDFEVLVLPSEFSVNYSLCFFFIYIYRIFVYKVKWMPRYDWTDFAPVKLHMSKYGPVTYTRRLSVNSISSKAARGQRAIKHINLWQLTPSRIDTCGFSDIKTFTVSVKVNVGHSCLRTWEFVLVSDQWNLSAFYPLLSPQLLFFLSWPESSGWVPSKWHAYHTGWKYTSPHSNFLKHILHLELLVWQTVLNIDL